MQSNVNVLVKEDNSVQEKIKRTAAELKKKYSTKRKVNEKWLMRGTSTTARVFSVIIDVILVSMCLICCLFGISSFIFKMNNLPPSFAGYSFMKVISPSMVDAGFEVGDTIVVQKVNTKTLNVGDHIAFFVYSKDGNQFASLEKENITLEKEETKHNYSLSFTQFIGVPTSEMAAAGKANARLVFHTIVDIYEDENGMYWFGTKGASNASKDSWKISERMVVGVYNDTPAAHAISGLLQLMTSNKAMIIIIAIPLLLMSVSFVFKMIKRVQITKLELDCIEEKRKITDEICVKNNVGFNMSKEDKYKILVQAPEDKREEYLALLWKDGSAPNSIRKYIIRKKFTLKENEQSLALHRVCEQMHAAGVADEEIARYYIAEKEKIEEEQTRYRRIFKNIRKKADEIKENAQAGQLVPAVAMATAVNMPEQAEVESVPVNAIVAEKPVEAKVAPKAETKTARKTTEKKTQAKAEKAEEKKTPVEKKKEEVKTVAKKKAPAKKTSKPKDVEAKSVVEKVVAKKAPVAKATEVKKDVKKAESKKTVAKVTEKKTADKPKATKTATKKVAEKKVETKTEVKTPVKKAPAKKVEAKVEVKPAKKVATKKVEEKKPVEVKTADKKSPAKKTTVAKSTTAKKPATKTTAVKKSTAKTTATKKSASKK